MDEHALDDIIIGEVRAADAAGNPIRWGAGPGADRRLKAQFGGKLRVGMSVICTGVNRLVNAGVLERVETGDTQSAYFGERTKTYPVYRLQPAKRAAV